MQHAPWHNGREAHPALRPLKEQCALMAQPAEGGVWFRKGAIGLIAGLRSSDARGRRALARGFAQRGQLAGLLPLRGGPLGRLLPDVGKLQARLVDGQL